MHNNRVKRSNLLSLYTPSSYKRLNIPGDGPYIARCFSKQFKEPLDRCLDRLQSEFNPFVTEASIIEKPVH